jgi:hypothetical protein
MGIRDLVKVANRLDNLGLSSEADALDRIIRKLAGESEQPQGMMGDNFDFKRESEKEAKRLHLQKLLPRARGIYVPLNFKKNKEDFKTSFIGGWNAAPDLGADKNEWNSYASDLADMLWEEMQAAPTAPTPAPKPAPKRPMTDDQRWAAYAGRVPGGDAVKVIWTKSGAGMALTGSETFDSFKEWMKSMMAATGMTSISASQLAGKLSDFKAAALADAALKRDVSSQGSILKSLYNTVSKDPAEYKRIVSSLGAKARAEGVMRESEQVGKEAVEAVYSEK